MIGSPSLVLNAPGVDYLCDAGHAPAGADGDRRSAFVGTDSDDLGLIKETEVLGRVFAHAGDFSPVYVCSCGFTLIMSFDKYNRRRIAGGSWQTVANISKLNKCRLVTLG